MKFSMMALIFQWNMPFAFFSKIKINLKWLSSKLHRLFIEISVMTTKNLMKLRWNVDEASMTAFSILCVNGPLAHVVLLRMTEQRCLLKMLLLFWPVCEWIQWIFGRSFYKMFSSSPSAACNIKATAQNAVNELQYREGKIITSNFLTCHHL